MKPPSDQQDSLEGGGAGAAASSLIPGPAAILNLVLRKWYWCLLSLCICLPLAYLYAQRLPFVYGKATTVMIKNDYPRESVATTVLATSNGIVNTASTNIDNEIFLLSSHSLMETVVRALSLDVAYWKKNGFRKEEIYTRTPLSVSFRDTGAPPEAGFRVVPVSETEFYVKSGVDEPHAQRKGGIFGEEMEFCGQTFTVEKTPYFGTSSIKVPIIVRRTSVKKAAMALTGGMTVKKANGKTNLINISVRCNNPYKAENVLNSVVIFYNKASLDEKMKRGNRTNDFIDTRLESLNTEMERNDQDIENLKKENDILTDLSTALTEEYENSLNDKKDLRELELEIKSIEYLMGYLEEEAENDAKLVPINTKIADMGIRDQIGVFNDTLLKKTSLKVNAGDNNPIVRELEANLLSLKDALRRSVNNYYTTLLVKKKNVMEQHEKTREHIMAVSNKEREVNRISREQRVRESLYVFLLNKREENALALAAPEDNARIVDAIRGGEGPVAPNVMKILLVGLLLGIAIPLVLCVAVAMTDKSIKNARELEMLTSVPVYGEIPRKPRKLRNEEIVVNLNPPSELSESFPLLADRLVSLADENGGSLAVLITSSSPEEGKTYVALNLALSLAAAGKKVLLMDMDLRKGKLSSLLGGTGKRGLGNLGEMEVEDWPSLIEQSPASEHLDYLYAGVLPNHPASLLLNDNFKMLINDLKTQYDFIFMDCIPYSAFADARIAARMADATFYVLRAGLAQKRDLAHLKKVAESGALPRMGFVLCDVEKPRARKHTDYRSFDVSSPCSGQ